jgi:hypothetical protein
VSFFFTTSLTGSLDTIWPSTISGSDVTLSIAMHTAGGPDLVCSLDWTIAVAAESDSPGVKNTSEFRLPHIPP